MVVDTSALVAIALAEPISKEVFEALNRNEPALIPATCFVEAVIVLSQRIPDPLAVLAELTFAHNLEVVAFDKEHAAAAAEAFLKFGKGRHPARLNFGDCMAYAVAKSLGMPLLYVGEDFAKTDVASA